MTQLQRNYHEIAERFSNVEDCMRAYPIGTPEQHPESCDCLGTGKVTTRPMRKPCIHKDYISTSIIALPPTMSCTDIGCPGSLAIEDMATLIDAIKQRGLALTLSGPCRHEQDSYFAQVRTEDWSQCATSWEPDGEGALTEAVLKWLEAREERP